MANGIARKGWDLDLVDGGISEDAFANILFRAKVEVKTDEICKTSGKVFVEVCDHGRPSGITTTTADFWVYRYLPSRWLVIETEDLRNMVNRTLQGNPRAKVKGGDHNNYDGVLIPIQRLLYLDLEHEH